MISKINVLKFLAISGFIMMVTSCGKEEDTPFKDCILPWEVSVEISQAELPKEIVDFTYQTYPDTDTLFGSVVNFCKNEKRLVIQPEGPINYDFLLYDNCKKLLAKGKLETDSNIRTLLSQSIQNELGNNFFYLYDIGIINYENSTKEYIAEFNIKGESTTYLFDNNGKILCKLF